MAGDMHRNALLDSLERYLARHPEDQLRTDPIRQFVRAHADCFERSNLEGHITASAWILSNDRKHFLMTLHNKLDRWLQLGGHADGDPDTARVALREAREESGMQDFAFFPSDGAQLPLDIDVHVIPERKSEPAHLHHDIRYLLVAGPHQELRISDESAALRWFASEDAERILDEESTLRMARRTRALLAKAR